LHLVDEFDIARRNELAFLDPSLPERLLDRVPGWLVQLVPPRLADYDRRRVPDVPAETNMLLHIVEARLPDDRKWVFLAINDSLLERRVELRKGHRDCGCVESLEHVEANWRFC